LGRGNVRFALNDTKGGDEDFRMADSSGDPYAIALSKVNDDTKGYLEEWKELNINAEVTALMLLRICILSHQGPADGTAVSSNRNRQSFSTCLMNSRKK
jgi:hypothetical protein